MYAKSGTCWGVMGDAEGFKKESEKKGLSQDLVLRFKVLGKFKRWRKRLRLKES